MKGKKVGIFISIAMMVFAMVGCSSEATPQRKGELRVAIEAQPPTLDPQMTTATITGDVGRTVFETLVTLNSKYEPVLMLAKSVDTSKDGKTYTFSLRKGVKFHNGKEMTSEDVVASMNRWLGKSPRAKMLLSGATFKAKDQYTVVLKLKESASDILAILSDQGQFPAIMPKEVIESEGPNGIKKYIGTGPFKFAEWKQDQYIHLTKYNDYQPVHSKPDGVAGKKEVFVDDLYFDIVTDPSTRLAGIQTGQYDIAYSLPYDNYEQLKSTPNVKTLTNVVGFYGLIFNKKEGLSANAKMRQAVNAALDPEKIMLASFSNDELYKVDPSYMGTEQKNWYSKGGKEAYNQVDPKKAKRLLKEAGYNGEEFRILATRDYDYNYNPAVVVKEQLEQIGIKVKLDVYDWATLVDRREDPKKWEAFITGFPPVTTPSQLLVLNSDWPGWTKDSKISSLQKDIRTAASQGEAKKHWDALQGYVWKEYLPIAKFGNYTSISATTDKVKGFTYFEGPVLWNTKVTN